ncbi:MAG: transposase [Kiritimatiellia bacterium]
MSNTGMLQRCWEHDYYAPSFYMITVVTEQRRNCLGALHAGPGGQAAMALSTMGEIVRDVWRRSSSVYPGVEACEHVVMPDHFHGILWVKERLVRPMGHMVKAFKSVSEKECRSRGLLLRPDPAAASSPVRAAAPAAGLWQPGFQDSILLRRGQLKAMAAYIADNPRRLAVKRANPSLFTVVSHLEIAAGRTSAAIGNRFLLQHPLKCQIQVSRRVSAEELDARRRELLCEAEHGAVLVSPCISPGEKAIARAALEAGRPLIVLLANGFAPQYKPIGRYFDACAAGRLLMIAPFPYQRQRKPVTREQCMELNEWAQAIVSYNAPYERPGTVQST